ncbi:MAG: hypothetical protein ACC657_13115 [Thiohalomonadales bacterium]
MVTQLKGILNGLFIVFIFISLEVNADEDFKGGLKGVDIKGVRALKENHLKGSDPFNIALKSVPFKTNLHSQLYSIYKTNQYLNYKLLATDKSLDSILTTLKSLEKKLDYNLKSNSKTVNSNNVTMADFESTDDNLVRKCDEIVDNYYTRKSQQEKKYVQDLFNNGQNDPQWEREIEDQLQNFITDNNFSQSEFFDINCKSSVCQLRVQHESSQASQQFRNKIRDDPDFDVYDSRNNNDRVTGGVITSITLVRDSKQIREFVWGR